MCANMCTYACVYVFACGDRAGGRSDENRKKKMSRIILRDGNFGMSVNKERQ